MEGTSDNSSASKINFYKPVLAGVFLLFLFSLGYYFYQAEKTSQLIEKLKASPANLTWQRLSAGAFWAPRDSHAVYEFNGQIFLSGGLDATKSTRHGIPNYEKAVYYSDLWSSPDGLNWVEEKTTTDFPSVRSHSVFSAGGKLILLGGWSPEVGYDLGIWTSEDGINWQKIKENYPWTPREGQKITHFSSGFLMTGGVNYFTKEVFNDVWFSADGLNWQELKKAAEWPARWDHDLAYYNGKLILAGGMTLGGGDGFDDVWESADGITWVKILSDAPFGKRQGHTLIEKDGVLFLVGGLDAKTDYGVGDTWYTKDGQNWQKTKTDGLWDGREDHGVILFNQKIFLLGGMGKDHIWRNDIWVSR